MSQDLVLANLKKRSQLLQAMRSFFEERQFIEVETPLLASEVIPELHIEPVCVGQGESSKWLQASPELHMKRLVAAGMEAIYQITRSFRGHERGPLHNPEFTILEWYRVGDDLHAGMDLLDCFCQTVTHTAPAIRTTYAEAFRRAIGLCPHTATIDELAAKAHELELSVPQTLPREDRDEWLNLFLAKCIEPRLGGDTPEILYDYPASQAALAKTVKREDGSLVAERFELYWKGIELANGYHELTDAAELRRRLTEVNTRRVESGRETLPLPESLLQDMTGELPACAGCALGVDRLLMVVLGETSIDRVRAFVENEE